MYVPASTYVCVYRRLRHAMGSISIEKEKCKCMSKAADLPAVRFGLTHA